MDVDGDYVFPNLRSGPGLLDVEVIDDETAGAVTLESGGSTLLIVDDLATGADETVQDDYTIRLTKRPAAGTTVDVAILTDGLADVVEIDGLPVTYQTIGGLRPTQIFTGSVIFENVAGLGTLTRGTGADLGSFVDEGFEAGQLLRIGGAGASYDGDYVVQSVTDQTITLTAAFGVAGPVEVLDTVALADLTREGDFAGEVSVDTLNRRLVRTDDSSWLADGFLEGQRVRVINAANPLQSADFKIAIIRGDNETQGREDRIHGRRELCPVWLTGTLDVQVTRDRGRWRPLRDTDWYVQQDDHAGGRPAVRSAVDPRGREGLPGLHAPAVQAPRSAGRRGRRHRRRPLAVQRPEAARRGGRLPVRHRHAAAGIAADRRAEHLQRLQPGRRDRHDGRDHAPRLRHGRRSGLRRDQRRDVRRAAACSPAGSASAR